MLTFRDYMESALYDPKVGFYSRRTPKEDFYTAPELHPLFAEILSEEICSRLKTVSDARPKSPLFIVEMGSGSGNLARQIIMAIKKRDPQWLGRTRYILVERVEDLLLESIMSLQDTGARLLGYSKLDQLQPMCGVFFSNELADALPVHVIEKQGGRMRELYVRSKRKHGGKLETRLGLLSSRALVHEARRIAAHLPEGGRHAVNLEARVWIRRIGAILKAGSVITVDYGRRFPAGAPNPPRAFYRHTVGADLTARMGRQDLTASVDFNDLIREGERAGMTTSSFHTLGRFLIDRGILSRLPLGADAAAFSERARAKTLFHPDGMGERFKVLIQEKSEC